MPSLQENSARTYSMMPFRTTECSQKHRQDCRNNQQTLRSHRYCSDQGPLFSFFGQCICKRPFSLTAQVEETLCSEKEDAGITWKSIVGATGRFTGPSFRFKRSARLLRQD